MCRVLVHLKSSSEWTTQAPLTSAFTYYLQYVGDHLPSAGNNSWQSAHLKNPEHLLSFSNCNLPFSTLIGTRVMGQDVWGMSSLEI